MTASTMLMIAPVALPLLASAAYLAFGWNRVTAWLGAAASAGLLAAAVALAARTAGGSGTALSGLLRADALSAFMLIVIGAVALLAMLASPAYLDAMLAAGHTGPRATRRYGVLTQAFVAAMALAVLAANLGVLWVAVEATTILTAFLVGFRRTRQATEAAWKYVVICSVGIALALLGIVMAYYAALHAKVPSAQALDWAELARHAAALDPGVMRMAVALLVLGFGAKAGLAPMHAWLPDAHSQAPAPVSALMSGVLLSVAFYAILRVKVISDVALGAGFARTLLIVAALASLAVAAVLLIAQRDYKRMLAYSSIEHMGLVALGSAVGGRLALAAVLLHVLGHGLGKSVLFLGSGHILQLTGSSRTDAVRGLAGRAPLVAGTFALGLAALLGLPPFSVFASELGIVRAGFTAGYGWAAVVALLLVAVAAAAMSRSAFGMLFGRPDPAPAPAQADGAARAARPPWSAAVPLVAGLALCAALGVTLGPLQPLLEAAADAAGGTP
ncbi:proton-conducting transporter membrane subunit [Thermostaphylospora chromogena]|uniref:Hydrogenase-4 component F n=1 Tax=Thermostaphylospora chromogena TaxID=35622 RepID=A0A1H1HF24_9ACTN|nr:proton-conducting transporter membrane subunit [Thermostaphylospora chromogena]SDR24032.1 hydrogenase-4 component F [Thermostaphylospora chromogena]